MRAVVSGAAGFVGSHLCDLLLSRGCEVVGLDSQITGSKTQNLTQALANPHFTFVEQDICQPWDCPGPVDAVLHLASPASPRDFDALQLDILRVHSVGMWNMLELARTKDARFLFTSSSEVYGDVQEHPQRESYNGNVNPVGERSCYDEGKRFGEALVTAYHRRYGLSTRIARLFNTYGPRMRLDDGRAIPNFVVGALRQEPLTLYGDGTQTRSPCYVTDTVRGLYRLLESDEMRPVNIGHPDEWSMLDLAHFINRELDSDAGVRFAPRLHRDDPNRRRPDITRARTVLGWSPQVQLRDGIRTMARWMQECMEKEHGLTV